jgi:ribosome-binding protein aMBF1 (putative translation factor)
MIPEDRAMRKVNLEIQKKIWEKAERENLPTKNSAKEMYLNLLDLVQKDELIKNYNYIHLGKNIRDARLNRKWTIKELASKTGLTPQCIQYIETGDNLPSMINFCKIVGALKCTPNQLLADE